MRPSLAPSGRLILLFGLASLAATAMGAFICAHTGVAASLWMRNLVAWAGGGLLALAIARTMRPRWLPIFVLAAPLGLAASLFARGQDDVHRWLDVGPVHLNVAMVLLPPAIVALAHVRGSWPWAAAFATLALLVVQPDASQATAYGAALALLAVRAPWRGAVRATVVVAVGLGVLAAWFRPDPLLPVAEVEGVLGLANAISPLAAALTVVLLAAACLAPATVSRSASAQALSLCLLVWAAAPLAGAFPVPWAGIGMSPILGAWLGVGLLAAQIRRGQDAV